MIPIEGQLDIVVGGDRSGLSGGHSIWRVFLCWTSQGRGRPLVGHPAQSPVEVPRHHNPRWASNLVFCSYSCPSNEGSHGPGRSTGSQAPHVQPADSVGHAGASRSFAGVVAGDRNDDWIVIRDMITVVNGLVRFPAQPRGL